MDIADTATQARQLYRENLWLRELLTRVAQDLEQLASREDAVADPLLRRAMRVRKRLHEGPGDWRPVR